MNTIQKAIAWMFQKAIGFPAWNVSSQMPSEYSRFFRETNAVDAMQQLAWVYNCCNLLGRRTATLPIDVVESDGQISVPVQSYISDLAAAAERVHESSRLFRDDAAGIESPRQGIRRKDARRQ
jgi:hypothetical protein